MVNIAASRASRRVPSVEIRIDRLLPSHKRTLVHPALNESQPSLIVTVFVSV